MTDLIAALLRLLNCIFIFIFNILLGVCKVLISLILAPIDLLINTTLPAVGDGFTAIGNFLSLCIQYIGWAINASALTSTAIALIIGYFVFKLTLPLNTYVIKLILRWYNNLKK